MDPYLICREEGSNDYNSNGRLPEGDPEEEIQQWRQIMLARTVKETHNFMLREKCLASNEVYEPRTEHNMYDFHHKRINE